MINIFKTSDKIIKIIEKQEGGQDEKNRIIGKILVLAKTKETCIDTGDIKSASKVEDSLREILYKSEELHLNRV